MKPIERDAYNQGIAVLAEVAQRSADVMRTKLKTKPTRFCFAIEALEAVVEAAKDLRLPDEPMGVGSFPTPSLRPRAGGAACVAEVV